MTVGGERDTKRGFVTPHHTRSFSVIKRALAVAVVVVVCLSCQKAPVGFLAIDGWAPQGEAATYDAAGLWELINGAADTFLSYGFEGVTVQNYAAGEVTVTVSAYDMGTPLNAFGVYRTEASPDGEALAIGGEAVVSAPYQCLLLKDRYYVKVDVYEGEIGDAAGVSLVEAIARAIAGSDGLPPEFAALPTTGMVVGSAQFTKSGLFGLAELDECLHAAYRDASGEEYRAFVVMSDGEDEADVLWTELAGSWVEANLDGAPALYREVPYSGLVGVAGGPYGLVGVADCADEAQVLERLRFLRAQ